MKKHLLRLSLTALLLISITTTQGGKQIGRGELELQVSAAAYSTDNLNANALSEGDEYFTFTPALTYTVDTTRIKLNSSLATPISRFSDRSELDSEDIIFSVGSTLPFLPNSPLYGNVNFSYTDSVEVDYFVNARVESKATRFGTNGGIKIGEKINLRGGFSYNERLTRRLSDYQTSSYYGGLQFNEVLGTANAFVDYRHQKRETIGNILNDGIDDIDEGIRFGMNGQILPERLFPKLNAELSFGIARSEKFHDESGNDFLIVSGSLRYPATPKTNVAFNISRNLTTTSLDQNVENFSVSLSFEQSPRQNLNFNWSIGYQVNDFGFSQTTAIVDRKDTTLYGNGAFNLIFSNHWSASVGFNYRDTDSNNFLGKYITRTFFLSTTRTF